MALTLEQWKEAGALALEVETLDKMLSDLATYKSVSFSCRTLGDSGASRAMNFSFSRDKEGIELSNTIRTLLRATRDSKRASLDAIEAAK